MIPQISKDAVRRRVHTRIRTRLQGSDERPRLNVYRPAHPDGSAVLVIAGGGYDHIELGNESTPACR